ncbi:VOC family protein [Streptomyces sp. NPDC048644]|uniref:VOC family protein n=1 Tax=Streptomyces sp. NPDC048644 TaxID=3365582 RepID=UPI00371C46BC
MSGAAGAAAVLDHLVLATPDLDRTVAAFAGLTGLRPVPGGSHPGRGTRNCLLGLGDGAYLEIIGPDREQPAPAGPRWFGIDALSGPCLVTWAARCTDIAARVARARAAGLDVGAPVAMDRRTPDGGTLAWQLTPPVAVDRLTPFLLDWGDTPHPAAALPVLPLRSLHATAPDPGAAADRLAALGVRWPGAPFAAGTAGLTAVVAGRHGAVRLGRGIAAV